MSVESEETFCQRSFRARFRQLAAGIEAIQEAHAELQRYKAERYNIFRVLGVARMEISTHSELLADFLNPAGRHGQEGLFLRRFLRMCQGISAVDGTAFPISPEIVDRDRWQVETEHHVAGVGRLDIVARCSTEGALLAIENKVDHSDGRNQLERYNQWLQRQSSYNRRALVYLTPKGNASPSSIRDSYFCISYREEIAQWLSGAYSEVKSPKVRSVLRQYLDVVRSL